MPFSSIAANVGNMARKGLRRASLSRYNELNAGDELRIPLKPFLAILRVMGCCFLFPTFFSNFMIKKYSVMYYSFKILYVLIHLLDKT